MRERSQEGAGTDVRLFQHAAGANQDTVGDFGIQNHVIGTNAASGPDARLAEDLDKWLDDRVGGDDDVLVNDAGVRVENCDAVGHELLALGHAHLLIEGGEFGAGIAAENFGRVRGLPRHHTLLRFPQNLRHVGEVVLAVRVGGGKFFDVGKQRAGGKNVEPGIDFVKFLLRGAGGFLFDDGYDFRAARTFVDDAAIAGGIIEIGG